MPRAAGVREEIGDMALSPAPEMVDSGISDGPGDDAVPEGGGDASQNASCGTKLVMHPFLPGMAACFADYLGMSMLTPALPYFLADLGMPPHKVATWTGAVTTAQYAGAACGNMIVGAMGDSLGSRTAMGATLAGDVLLFAATAFSTNVALLTTVRCFAGLSSPLVASLHYILRSASTKKETLRGVNAYSASVNIGYAFGGVIVGVGYDALGWAGLMLLSSGIAGIALVVVLVLVPRNTPEKNVKGTLNEETGEDGVTSPNTRAAHETAAPKKSVDVYGVYKTGAMVSHMVTAVNVGYQFMGFLVLFTLMSKQILGWSAAQLGWSFMAIPIANTFAMYYFIPPLIGKLGVHALITYSSVCTAIVLGAFALPAVHTSVVGILAVTFCLILCVVTVQVPNQMRIKIIADEYAPEQVRVARFPNPTTV